MKAIFFLIFGLILIGCGTGAVEESRFVSKQPDKDTTKQQPKKTTKNINVNAGEDVKILYISDGKWLSAKSDCDCDIKSYKWVEGNKTLSTKKSFLYIPDSVGVHKLNITVTDKDNNTATDTIIVNATNQLPLVVIRVEFQDYKFHSDASTWSKKIFGTDEGELNNYYNEVSYGKLQFIKADENDGIKDGIITISLDENHPGNGVDYQSFLPKIVKMSDKYIDFAKYDTNHDNNISMRELQIMFIIAGGENATGNYPGVWAHAHCIANAPILDGKKIMSCGSGTYSLFGERHKYNNETYDATIGIIAHELAHASLGLIDLYDRDGSSLGIGNFGLMGSGNWGYKNSNQKPGTTPIHMCAWSKIESKFIKPIDVNSDITISLIETSNSKYRPYKIPTKNKNEYFLVENRENSGYDRGLFTLKHGENFIGGLLISHIDESIDRFEIGNDNEEHKLVDIEEAAHQILDTNQSTQADIYNLYFLGNVDSFTPTTSPNSNLYDGNRSNIFITNISDSGSTMTADIQIQP